MENGNQRARGKVAASHLNVAVVGGGSIGVGFAVMFAKAGARVKMAEPSQERRASAPGELETKLMLLHEHGLLREPVATISRRVEVQADVENAVADADLVQECVPEKEEVKQDLFARLATLTDGSCVLASSSSFMPSSTSAHGSGAASRALVAHPGNPPFAIPVIELVPNPDTQAAVVRRAKDIYTAGGMSPVLVKHENEGFVFNRLQGALLREAYALVRDGVAGVEDIDTVVRDGLGRRWAFMGPFETVDLNTRGGIAAHAVKMGPSYRRMGLERGDSSEWTESLVAEVESQRRAQLPLDKWENRVAWRDEQLLRRMKDPPAGTD